MDVKKLGNCIKMIREDLGEGVLAVEIFSAKGGQGLVSHNGNPAACAMFARVTENIQTSLAASGFPDLGRYYIMDLADNKLVVVVPLGDYQMGMLVDKNQVMMGMLMSIVIPKAVDAFEEALVSGE